MADAYSLLQLKRQSDSDAGQGDGNSHVRGGLGAPRRPLPEPFLAATTTTTTIGSSSAATSAYTSPTLLPDVLTTSRALDDTATAVSAFEVAPSPFPYHASAPALTPAPTPAAAPTNRQTRLLALRKTHFRGSALPSQNVHALAQTQQPSCHVGGMANMTQQSRSPTWMHLYASKDHDAASDLFDFSADLSHTTGRSRANSKTGSFCSSRRNSYSQPQQAYRTSPAGESPSLGILQEISNSSMRRRNNMKPDLVTAFDVPTAPYDSSDDEKSSPAFLSQRSKSAMEVSSIRSTKSKSSNPRRMSTTRRSLSGETSRYIEHLESQLAAMQAQLQTYSSPSSKKSASAKLRAVNSESRILKQELCDWEEKFDQRVSEQLEQHELIVAKLRAEMRVMLKTADLDNVKLKELEHEAELRSRQLEAIEGANHDLERRLEFMSELLATSPSKIDLHFDTHTLSTAKKHSARPRSIDPPPPLRHAFPSHSRAQSQARLSPVVDGQVTVHTPSPFDGTCTMSQEQSQSANDSCTEVESTTSESTLIESDTNPSSPSRRHSLSHSTYNSANRPPNRRMRKFYSGTNGPRALILPATTHAGSFPQSAPVSGSVQTPSGHESRHFFRQSYGSTTPWDAITDMKASMAFPPVSGQHGCTLSHDHRKGDFYAQTLPKTSMDSVEVAPGCNLFEELSHFKRRQTCGSDHNTNSRPSTATPAKVSGMPSSFVLVSSPTPSADEATEDGGSTTNKVLTPASANVVRRLTDLLSRTLERERQSAGNVITLTWLRTRCFLVRLLLGDIRRKQAQRKNHDGVQAHGKDIPSAPGATWLKLTLTLACAVVIAMKDGPSSLFS